MSGLKLTIPTTFTNPALPYMRDDSVLPKQGAMLLIDPTHPASSWAAGVPADGTYLPNLAGSQLSSLVGSSLDADIKPKMIKPAGGFTGTAGLLERTTKGGLHGISPKAGGAIAGGGPTLAFSTKIMAYILANPLHDYYMSVWMRVTREPTAGYNNSSIVAINGGSQQTNSYLFNVASNATVLTSGSYLLNPRPNVVPPRLGLREDGASTLLGNKYLSLATDQWWTATAGLNGSLPGDGTNTSVTGSQAGGGLPFGSATAWPGIGTTGTIASANFGVTGSATNKDKVDSHIVYRFYLEDLTVSGRSHATVDALSYAEYTKHVLTVGGRYYGDTFTDPATIP